MAASTSRPSTASARIRSKTSELSDLFRGRQHSSVPSPSTDSSSKPKRKIPLFSLRKKSPAPRPGQRSPTLTPVPTPRPSTNTNVYVPRSVSPQPDFSFFSSLRRAEPHIRPWSQQARLDHSFRSSAFLRHPFPPYLRLKTRLPNVPQPHLQTQDLNGQ